MDLNGVLIEDTFAEAFPMRATRVLITADEPRLAMTAATAMTGFATSVIACGCEAGIERELEAGETPDGRPGVAVLLFAMSDKDLATQLVTRVGQCVLTCASTACFAGLEGEVKASLGKALRFFGDGYQFSKKLGDRRYWRVPVMDGEFVVEDVTGVAPAVGGGNFLILGTSRGAVQASAEAAIVAMRQVPGVIMPFPGGIVRSGSKVGSKYKGVIASTNDAYSPTLRGAVNTALDEDIGSVLEIVIDGLTPDAVGNAMRAGLAAIIRLGPRRGAVRVGAGNYGGKLGPHHFHLKDLLP